MPRRSAPSPDARPKGWRPSLEDSIGSCLAFAYRYMAHLFYLPPAPMHHEWDEIALDPDIQAANIQAHRDSAKTTFWSIAYPAWRTCLWLWLSKQGRPQDDEHGAIFCVDKDAAKDRLRQVRHEMEHNKAIQRDFGPIRVGAKTWTASQFVIEGARDVKNPTLYADGMGAIPGSRLTYAILDDTTHPLHVHSHAQRDKQFKWTQEVVEPSLIEGAPIRAIHTTFHNDDLPARLRKAGWWSKKWPLVKDEDKRVVQWPQRWPWERVAAVMKKPLVYARQYQLREVLESERLLPMPEHLYYDPRILTRDGTVWRINGEVVRFATGVDPALSERDLKENSRTAIVTIALLGNRDKYVVECKAGRWDPDTIFSEVTRTWEKWHSSGVFIESVAFSSIFAKLFRSHTAVPAFESPARGDKIERIVGTLNPPMANRKIFLPDPAGYGNYDPLMPDVARDGMAILLQEQTDFPGDTKDCLDGLEHAVRNVETQPIFRVAGDRLITSARAMRARGSSWIGGARGYGD